MTGRKGAKPRHYTGAPELTHGNQRRREILWAKRGVREYGGGPLTWVTWRAVVEFQHGGCALCGRNEFWGSLHADHSDETGLFRGALCAECNRRAVGGYERFGKFRSEECERLIRFYLKEPPYQRWFATQLPKVSVSEGSYTALPLSSTGRKPREEEK